MSSPALLGLVGLAFGSALGGSVALAQAEPPVQISHAQTPEVRLAEECILFSKGTVDVPILVKHDSDVDGLQVSIDYDEVFLGYAWYRTASTDWRVEKVQPYGQHHITIVLKRTSRSPPADPDAEPVALYAVFYLKDTVPEGAPFRMRTELSLGPQGGRGSLDTYFFTMAAGQEAYSPVKTRITSGSVSIYYRDGVEAGGGSVTRREQAFTLPLYLTYTGAAGDPRTFTVGIDYDEIFLGLTGVRGLIPPLAKGDEEIAVKSEPLADGSGTRATFRIEFADSEAVSACHVHVADLELTYNGLSPPDDKLVVVPRILTGTAGGDPAPEADAGGDDDASAGAGASGPGTTPGVVDFLPAYFVRGNADASFNPARTGAISVRGDPTDVLLILESIFLGRSNLPCADAGDVNDNGKVELSDAVLLLNYLFRGGPQPVAPFPNPGLDGGVDDDLGCNTPLPYFRPAGFSR